MLLTGFTVVFAMLLFLIFIIWGYGKIISAVQKKSAQRKAEKAAEAPLAEAQPVSPEPAPAAPAVSGGVCDELAAVISAAVYCMYGSKDKVKIKSIKRSSSRSAWANAGVADNTRPF